MTEGKFLWILTTIIPTLCDKIKNYYHISYEEAIKLLYNSKLYNAIEDEETKMWYYSTYDLFKMFVEEQETGSYTIYG